MIRFAPLLVVMAWLFVGAPINVVAPVESVDAWSELPIIADDSDLVLYEPVVVAGKASWYDAKRNGQSAWYTRAGIKFYAAAGPALRAALGGYAYRETYEVKITNLDTGLSATAWVVDWCQCSEGRPTEKAVDLSPALFKALGVSLSRGVQRVTIEVVD